MAEREGDRGMKGTAHAPKQMFRVLTESMGPQDRQGDGTGLQFESGEHGADYPDNMPQAITVTDTEHLAELRARVRYVERPPLPALADYRHCLCGGFWRYFPFQSRISTQIR
jgi:hypothetical protein